MSNARLFSALAREGSPVTGESRALFPWWSITKTVLAAAALRLVDEGRLSLDSPFKDRRYTLRHLLQHTAGVNTYGGPSYHGAVAAGDPVWPVEDLLARLDADTLLFEPGNGWSYSNVGYLFVRQLIEETTGTHIDASLRKLVFEPMDLQHTRIATTLDDLGLTKWGNAKGYDPGWVYHSLLIGPPSDAVSFLRRLFARGFLSAKSARAMRQVYALGDEVPGRPWRKTGYGLGLMIGTMVSGGQVYGHSGGGPGSTSALYCFADLPDRPIVAVFAQGNDEGIAEYEAERLALSR